MYGRKGVGERKVGKKEKLEKKIKYEEIKYLFFSGKLKKNKIRRRGVGERRRGVGEGRRVPFCPPPRL